MVNPFDFRTVLLAKHAQHVVLIHFPIALFITGVGLDLLSGGKRGSQLASAAYLNISIAAAMVIPAALTGILAWQFALDGKRLKGLLLFHVIAASVAALLVITSQISTAGATAIPYSGRIVWGSSHCSDRASRGFS